MNDSVIHLLKVIWFAPKLISVFEQIIWMIQWLVHKESIILFSNESRFLNESI